MTRTVPDAVAAYRTMALIRRFEEAVVDLVNRGEIPGATHEYTGQEAVAVGVCAALEPSDVITSTHRGHGHIIAKGAPVRRVLAELTARDTGLNRGRGGSMHAADVSLGILGANGIVGAGAPIAVGAAYADRLAGRPTVAVSFFGDGALNQGAVLEAMNLAVIWNLPVVFVCENNGYAVTLKVEDAVGGDILERAAAFGMLAIGADGMDIASTYEAADRAVQHARSGRGPAFVMYRTYRFVGHNTGEQYLGVNYRSDAEIDAWRLRDPIELAAARLSAAQRAELDSSVAEEMADAVRFALESERPRPETAMDYQYADIGSGA